MDDSMKHSLLQDPTKYGISENMLIQFSEKEPLYVHLSYLDLFTNEIDKRPDAVVEINGRAALYLVSENIFTIDELRQLKEILASRADARFLGVLRAGVIDIYPLGIFSENDDQPIVKKIDLSESSINLHDFLIGNLTDKLYKKNNQRKVEQSWLENYLFRLLQTTARNLRENISANKLTDNQILSLVGRALFTRFLIDRKIIVDSDVGNISNKTSKLNNLFNSVSSISDTFAWLDKTFNGNLLPLGNFYYNSEDYNEFFSQIGDESEHICFELQDILLATINRQMSLDWGRIQFQHVPADMLSQVYEHFAHAYQNEFARKTSIHYTPSHIAKILVDSAFDGLEIEDKSSAQILDPSAGAGVFLVLAFKRLVLEKWKITGERPTRNQIRGILNHQLVGLDINSESLKFAALSLYLTALELDPNPTPLSELKFDGLNTKTLINVSFGEDLQETLGSLSERLPVELNERFDIVVGNPPWTKQRGRGVGKKFNELIERIAISRGIDSKVASQFNVGCDPDIPFIWRAIEWCKPNGMIAYALHAQHTLFNYGNSFILRSALLDCIELTGIFNGSALRQEKAIWENNDAPFCFLIAKNKKPSSFSSFYYLSPYVEKSLNEQGGFRMDPHMAIPVEQSQVQANPHLLKTLFRGSWLDHEIIEKIRTNSEMITLQEFCDKWKLICGSGFQLGSQKVDASLFKGKYLFDSKEKNKHQYIINTSRLHYFYHDRIYGNRNPQLFKAPLVLFLESPPPFRNQRGALLSIEEVIYSESYVGVSTAKHSSPLLLAKYLQLISYSNLFLYYFLMTSAKFGVERDAILTKEIFTFPLIDFGSFNEEQLTLIESLSEKLINREEPWNEIDQFMASIYGLNKNEMQVIEDSLKMSLPYAENKKVAQNNPENETLECFQNELCRVISPFTKRLNLKLWTSIEENLNGNQSGWKFIRIGFSEAKNIKNNLSHKFLSELADQFWVSQVKIHIDETGCELLIGQLAQNRYWTKTKARLLALDILNTDLERAYNYCEGIQ
ncbi:class I SAM-dependent DNA methyltransferase [Acinetobacter venetianus]|uniref:HsdM family class I SAM-dependent methyltransferase n=1 Tax=Acinetobacter venetianus TaxID=52133 RepID=UPI001A10CC8D|nr:N-6 DNA methylase [Acinetobacter venetianus]HIQ34603.1 hypothetical protein [Acinetobacter venetianus]HJP47772.1 N-6 DNA methylase [Acinetobacter venetianus]